jgi:hypothetical protein
VADRLNGLLESLTAEVQAWHRIEREIIALASASPPSSLTTSAVPRLSP